MVESSGIVAEKSIYEYLYLLGLFKKKKKKERYEQDTEYKGTELN